MDSKKWIKAQQLEPLHWAENREKISNLKYQEKIKVRSNHILNTLKEHAGEWTYDESILEIGGGATPLITHTKFKNQFLVDPLMDFYIETFPSVFPSSAEYEKSKGEVLPYKDNSFDMLVSRNVLDHVDDVNQCLDEMKRVLKPGGLAYIGMNVFAGPLLIYKTIFKDPEHPYTFSESSFTNLIAKDFSILKTRKNDPINGNHFVEMEDSSPIKSFLRNMFLRANNYAIIEMIVRNDK